MKDEDEGRRSGGRSNDEFDEKIEGNDELSRSRSIDGLSEWRKGRRREGWSREGGKGEGEETMEGRGRGREGRLISR